MIWLVWSLNVVGFWPLWMAWQANRRTSLRDAIAWAWAAWFSWGFALGLPANDDLAYLALCFTGCAGVAVLGARRPHVFAWNFVVLGLMSVMCLPLLEAMVIRVHSFNIERKIFLAGILFVTIINYVPTRFAVAALSLGIGSVLKYLQVLGTPLFAGSDVVALIAIAIVPWLALVSSVGKQGDPFDQLWRDFRDRFGFVWGSRTKEQFNAAARHAELPFTLGWWGRIPKGDLEAAVVDKACQLFRKSTRRFSEEVND